MALINAVTKTGLETESSLEEAKKKIFLQLTEQFNDISSFEELEAVKKIIAPIKPTIDALRYQKENINLAFPSTSRTPSNKKIVPQRKFFPTKKNIKRKRAKLLKPSSEEANLLAIKALKKKQTKLAHEEYKNLAVVSTQSTQKLYLALESFLNLYILILQKSLIQTFLILQI
ncbi:hypothetical protein NQ315_015924 [Exocentrus adspersus]|uniref:Uncharacterized protein n=1 Tax=Exocentrus adspersus TaxID=1586481 RepID=A0AAV8V7R4_9CUCU|nr:hypothetical protein NQ315_015924 [Exocentrus adspersus]